MFWRPMNFDGAVCFTHDMVRAGFHCHSLPTRECDLDMGQIARKDAVADVTPEPVQAFCCTARGHDFQMLRTQAGSHFAASVGWRLQNTHTLAIDLDHTEPSLPADGIDAIKTFVVDCVLDAGGKTCPPTIVGVGVGGTGDLCVHLSKVAATRALGTRCSDAEGAELEAQLTAAVNQLGVGPQGLGGDATSFAVHIELAATHITMNPVAVNMQCHSARRARATWTPAGLAYGF